MVDSGTPATWLLLAIAAPVLGVALLFNKRTRLFGGILCLSLLGIGLIAAVSQNSSRGVVLAKEVTVTESPHSVRGYVEPVMQAPQDIHSSPFGVSYEESLRAQRLDARQPDALVHHGDNGQSLETYPDGMQIRQLPGGTRELAGPAGQSPSRIVLNQRLTTRMDPHMVQQMIDRTYEEYADGMKIEERPDGVRQLVRPAYGDSASAYASSSFQFSESSSGRVVGFAFFPFLAILVMFLLARRKSRGGGLGWVVGAVSIAACAFLAFGFIGFSRVRTERIGPPSPAPEAFAIGAEGRSGLPVIIPPDKSNPLAQQSGALRAPRSTEPPPSVDPPPSLDAIWETMNAPRISLVPAAEAWKSPTGQPDLAEAAKMIVTTTLPGADPFTQGWMTDAVKAITRAAETNAQAAIEQSQAVAAHASSRPSPAGLRPQWLVQPPALLDGNVQRVVVSVGPYVTLQECQEALTEQMRLAVHRRAQEKIKEVHGENIGLPWMPQSLGLSTEFIAQEFRSDTFAETVDTSVGEMQRAYALMEFGPMQDQMLVSRWEANVRSGRISSLLKFAAAAMGCLALIFGLLKVDTWTRGYYSKRLFIGVPAAILLVGVTALLLGAS